VIPAKKLNKKKNIIRRNKNMPAKRRSKARPKTSSTTEEGRKLSLKDIKEEIDDLTIFEGVLAYAKLQQKYSTNPKEVEMSFKEFEAKIEEFKKEEIYKPETTLETSKAQDVQTTPTGDNKQEGDF
jgi:hypothetical protein